MSRQRSAVSALADRAGILSQFVDAHGRVRHASESVRTALLAALGLDASTERAARRTLAEWEQREANAVLAPVSVVTRRRSVRMAVNGAALSGAARYVLEVATESGTVHRREGRVTTAGTSRLPLPPNLPAGYHRARLRIATRAGERQAEQLLVVAPPQCPGVARRLGRRRVFGVTVQLYTVRSARDWGVGDLTDLTRLARWAAGRGAAFVGVNPLHALRNDGDDISPYCPVSRLFHNPLYLDPAAVPEFATSEEARRLMGGAGHRAALERLRRSERVHYGDVMERKWAVLRLLHREFRRRHGDGTTPRGRAYRRFRAAHGAALVDFATFVVIRGATPGPLPAALADPTASGVRGFRAAHAEEIDLQCYVQFELDRQLASAARTRLPLGLLADLAIGTAPEGGDVWAFPQLFPSGAHLGAPPDVELPEGQDWRLAPLHPHQLRAGGYGYWIAVLRAALRHAGALRIDHVMGLFRQYWIPPGGAPADGAYVQFPAGDLLAILALEASRRNALIVGEDLGTVPRGLPAVLRRWGILSTRLLYFERNRSGTFRPAQAYSRRALVAANTHDQIPLAGYVTGRDLALRRQVGAIENDAALAAAQARRSREVRAMLRRLSRAGVLRPDVGPLTTADLSRAVHTFLARTPAPLVAVNLDDLTGETEPVNLPGVGLDRYPSWSRRLRLPLERLSRDRAVARALGDQSRRVWRR